MKQFFLGGSIVVGFVIWFCHINKDYDKEFQKCLKVQSEDTCRFYSR